MKRKSSIIAALGICLLVAGCGSGDDNFGTGFNNGWQDGGVDVVWQAATGASARGLVPGTDGDEVCVVSPSGRVIVVGVVAGDIRSNSQTEGGIAAGGNCARGRIAAALQSGQGVMIDAGTAKVLWRVSLPAAPLGAPIIAGDSTVFVLANGNILSYSAYAGKQLWKLVFDSSRFRLGGHFEPLLASGRVYIGMPSGEIVALFAETGVLAWQEKLVDRVDPDPYRNLTLIAAPVLTGSGSVCAAAFRGKLACFDRASGRLLWRKQVSSLGAVASGQHVYVVDESGSLQARGTESGELRWTAHGASADRTPALVVSDGKIVVADGFQGISVYNENGDRIGGLRLRGEPVSMRPLDDGKILVLTDAGGLSLLAFSG